MPESLRLGLYVEDNCFDREPNGAGRAKSFAELQVCIWRCALILCPKEQQ
jgi:hypothetical protein